MNTLNTLLSKLRNRWTLFFVIGAIIALLTGYKWGSSSDPKVVYVHVDKIVHVVDTLKLKEVVYKQLPARIDTMLITHTVNDTIVQVLTEVASIDTTLSDGRLSLRYYTKPRYFDFSWQPVPLEVRCKQFIVGGISLEKPRLISFSAGLGLGRSWDEKDWAYSGLFAGHLRSNMVYLEASRSGYTIGYGRRFY